MRIEEAGVGVSGPSGERRPRRENTLLWGRARIAQAALAVAMAFMLLAAFHDGNPRSTTSVIVVLLDVIMRFVAAIAWWVWMYRAYRNIQALGHVPNHDASRVVWSFLIPIANWILPYQSMTEIWHKSRPVDGLPGDDFAPATPLFLPLWWGFFFARTLSSSLGRISDGVTLFVFDVAFEVLGTLGAMYVLEQMTSRQEAAFEGSLSGAPPTF